MTNEELNKWGKSIIERVKLKSSEFGDPPLSFATFYSPLVMNPDLMVIGDNPGGAMDQISLEDIPLTHDYFKTGDEDYKMAIAMREKIFNTEYLRAILKDSVKTNRICFRTPDLQTLNALPKSKEILRFSEDIFKEMIETLKPKAILAESFGCYEALDKKWETLVLKPNSTKALLLRGNYQEIPVFGINHPSSARGISTEDWKLVSVALEKEFLKLGI